MPLLYSHFREIYCPRGRVWGGSSSLNAMVYIRGHAFDYDRWQDEGCDGWSYEHCLPYFRKAQTHSLGTLIYRCWYVTDFCIAVHAMSTFLVMPIFDLDKKGTVQKEHNEINKFVKAGCGVL